MNFANKKLFRFSIHLPMATIFQFFSTHNKILWLNFYKKTNAMVPLFSKNIVLERLLCTVVSEKKKPHQAVEDVLQLYSESDSIPWDDVKEKIRNISMSSVHTNFNALIFNSCYKNNFINIGVSFYDFLKENKEKLKIPEYYLVLKLFSSLDQKPKQVLELHTEKLLEIFNAIKPYLSVSENLFTIASSIYFVFENCWKDLLELYTKENLENIEALTNLAAGAFYHDKPEIGWDIVQNNQLTITNSFTQIYFNHCISKAENNMFSETLIDSFIYYCNKNRQVIPCPDLLENLSKLCDILNQKNNSGYTWKAEKCKIIVNRCSHCNSKLVRSEINQKDFECLKNHIFNDVMFNKNFFLKSSNPEVKRFLSFLENSSPYDVVIDGLNAFYVRKSTSEVLKVIKYFRENLKKDVLLIFRKHFLRKDIGAQVGNHCQIFYTDDLSDDDVFVIYAALYGGIQTAFLTGDFYRGHASKIKDIKYRQLFTEWQLSRQFTMKRKKDEVIIIPPSNYSVLPQRNTRTLNKDICWHLPVKENPQMHFKDKNLIHWICLHAEFNSII